MCYLKKFLSKKFPAQRLHNTTLCKELSPMRWESAPTHHRTQPFSMEFHVFFMILWYMGIEKLLVFLVLEGGGAGHRPKT